MTQKELDKKLNRLGFPLKDQRENMFISICKVAKDLKLNRHTISNIENGKGQIASFVIYANYFGMELLVFKSEKLVDSLKYKEEV